jgi:MerR family transcriptional regulator, light-induced transcriptional regulator
MRGDGSSLTVGQAAKRFGVAPATIQRWVDGGVLQAERTIGGHRRIPIGEVRRVLATLQPRQSHDVIGPWLDTFRTGDAYAVRAALLAARQRHGTWAATADEVASAIEDVGRHWEIGECKVFEEHLASEALRRAAAGCAESIRRAQDAPRAILFSAAEERHTLGLSLAELVLAETGWSVLWVGEGPPIGELADLVAERDPHLLVVSASAASKPKALRAYQDALLAVTRRAQVALILGGGAPWRPSRDARRVLAFEDLRRVSVRLWDKVTRRRRS